MSEAILRTKITGDATEFERSIKEAIAASRELSDKIGDNIKETALQITGLVIGVESLKEVLDKVYEGVRGVFDLSRDLRNLSNQTGASVKDLVQLRAEFDLSGIAADNVGGILNRMQRSIEQASDKGGPLADMFYRIGLNLYDLQQMNPAQQFDALRQKLTAIEDPARRAQIAMKIFGNFGGGGSVLSIFGNSQIAKEAAEAISEQADILSRNAQTFQETSIELERARMSFSGFFIGLAEPLSKVLLPVLEEINAIDWTKWGSEIGGGLTDTIRVFYNALKEKGGIGDVLETSFKGLADGFIASFTDGLRGAADVFVGEMLKVLPELFLGFRDISDYFEGLAHGESGAAYEKDRQEKEMAEYLKQQGVIAPRGWANPYLDPHSRTPGGPGNTDNAYRGWLVAQREAGAHAMFTDANGNKNDIQNVNQSGLSFMGGTGNSWSSAGQTLIAKAASEFGKPVADAIAQLLSKYGSPVPNEGKGGGSPVIGGGGGNSGDFSGFGRGENISGFYGDKGGFHGAYAWAGGPVNIESGMAGRAGRVVSGPQSVEENTHQTVTILGNIDRKLGNLGGVS